MAKYQIKGRFWIERDGETFLGYGRVILLQRIDELGSISKAARSMGMGYRHAWRLVESMNKNSPVPLVIKKRGGAKGGGAALTESGRKVIDYFWQYSVRFRELLKEESEGLNSLIERLPHQHYDKNVIK